MKSLKMAKVKTYVNNNIDVFHQSRLRILSDLKLSQLVKKNPYLFRAKNITKASELVEGTMTAFLSSSEEKLFGDFLEGLAIFVAQQTTKGHKSTTQGVDLEFIEDGVHYVVAIKSGPSWGNSSQIKRLGQDLNDALVRLKQSQQKLHAESVLGICYGKTKTRRSKTWGYLKLVGQNFWTFISGNQDLYTSIIEPLGYRAKEHNDAYVKERDRLENLLINQFVQRFCDKSGVIDWGRVVQANSGNYDLDKMGFDF